MKKISSKSAYGNQHQSRFLKTIKFMEDLNLKESKLLNLGPSNPMSEMLREENYDVTDTAENQDLDLDFEIVKDKSFDVVVGFEILEHMVSPFPLLKSIAGTKLVLSVPLSYWFAKAYWNENDPLDCHYHEFEPRQFCMLLEKAGWSILKEEKHTSPRFNIGIRPLLRMFTYRHYFVYCERL